MKNLMLISSLVAVVVLGTFAVDRNTGNGAKVSHSHSPPHPSQQSADSADHAIYDFLFRDVIRLRDKTRELQAQGRIGPKPYFALKREIGLTDSQATALEAIAFACRQRVAQQDEKAKASIAAFQKQFAAGKVPADGPPPPPPELKLLWEERKAIVLSARDQVRAALGESTFARFHNYAKTHYSSGIPAQMSPKNPKNE